MREASRKLSQDGLQEASFRQAQDIAESLPCHRSAPASHRKTPKRSLTAKTLLEHFALEGETSKLLPEHPPVRQEQLDSDKLEQLMLEMRALQEVVRKFAGGMLPPTSTDELAANNCKQDSDSSNNNNNNNNTDNNNNNTTNTNNNINNEPNNYNDNNKSSQESGLNSFDLDNDNPESDPDLDSTSLGNSNPTLGVVSSLDQQGAAQSLKTKGQQQTMTIGISLGSLIQNNQNGQEGMQIGTAWDPSLMRKRPKKKVSFDETSLAHNKKQQNNRQQAKELHTKNFQLRQLGSSTEKQELPEQNNKSTTCWNNFQQESDKQQQTASASAKELQHKACQNNSLGREGQTLGSLESETQTQQACRCPSHNNTSNLGIGTKNRAAWSILIDTGAAISLAPIGFAQHIELSPFEGTLQLRSITGEVIQAFGRRTVWIACSQLSFCVSFVIANVQHAVLGMDALMANQLSLVRNIFNEYYLVNAAAATTQLHTKGQLLYIEACPREFGFSNCKGSSFQNQTGSLLNDKGRTQEETLAASGGACDNSFSLENLREQQAKNTANLGTPTASPGKGAKRRKKKKPSAKKASQDGSQRSLEQQGQQPATTQLRSLEKIRIMDELEMVAEKEANNSLGSTDLKNLSLRILLTLSLRNKWLITTTRATGACSQDALAEQLRNIGLGQNKVQPNIFSGDELVILLDETSILIGGTEIQQECFFCELSALASLEPPNKLAQNTPISFGNLMMEYQQQATASA